MKVFKKIKNFFDRLDEILNNDPMMPKLTESDVQGSTRKNYPPLSAYETRREEIQASDKLIEGIFYLYDGEIIPDYYSECLVDDRTNPIRKQMYHFIFYKNYMRQKFSGLHYGEKSLPRGRVDFFNNQYFIYIDKCFVDNKAILSELAKLYRIDESYQVSSTNYRCPACEKSDNDS